MPTPGGILLLTFTRRAAEAMVRRAERICGQALGGDALRRPLEWAGTFHAIGARLLRHYADAIGLDPGFTILDRGDAADLIDLVRDELRLGRTDRRFPQKGTCLAIYSYAVNAQAPLRAGAADGVPLVRASGRTSSSGCSAPMSTPSSARVCSTMTISCCGGSRWWPCPRSPPTWARRFDFVLVDEYQDTNAIQAAILQRAQAGRARASPWSATTRRRSTPSAPPPCATSWTSRRASRRRPRS